MGNHFGAVLKPAVERFAAKIALTDSGCIEWIGGLNGVGYGQFYVGKKRPGDTGKGYAHRWSYEYHIGPIPEGAELDHLCRNRACVNPEHLEPLPQRVNLLRGSSPAAAHARKRHCPAGHEYAGRNLYINPNKRERRCRECSRLRSLAQRVAASEARKAS